MSRTARKLPCRLLDHSLSSETYPMISVPCRTNPKTLSLHVLRYMTLLLTSTALHNSWPGWQICKLVCKNNLVDHLIKGWLDPSYIQFGSFSDTSCLAISYDCVFMILCKIMIFLTTFLLRRRCRYFRFRHLLQLIHKCIQRSLIVH